MAAGVIASGFAGLVAALLCGVGFVAATVRADERARADDPAAAVTGARGAARLWLLAGVTLVVLSVAVIVAGIVT